MVTSGRHRNKTGSNPMAVASLASSIIRFTIILKRELGQELFRVFHACLMLGHDVAILSSFVHADCAAIGMGTFRINLKADTV